MKGRKEGKKKIALLLSNCCRRIVKPGYWVILSLIDIDWAYMSSNKTDWMARKQIHRLSWNFMRKSINGKQQHSHIHLARIVSRGENTHCEWEKNFWQRSAWWLSLPNAQLAYFVIEYISSLRIQWHLFKSFICYFSKLQLCARFVYWICRRPGNFSHYTQQWMISTHWLTYFFEFHSKI